MAFLVSLLINRNWKGNIHLNVSEKIINDSDTMDDLINIIRLPSKTDFRIYKDDIDSNLDAESGADLHVFSLNPNDDIRDMVARVQRLRVSAVFCMDSGIENASL